MKRPTKLLIITASPKKISSSSQAAQIFVKEFGANIKTEIIDINKYKIKSCKAAFTCEKTFECYQKDDASMLIKKVENADVVVVASPVYFAGIPGPLKTFIDRNNPIWNKRFGNYTKGYKPKQKKGIIILTAGSDKDSYFKPPKTVINSFFTVHNIKLEKVMKFKNLDKYENVANIKRITSKIKAVVKESFPSLQARKVLHKPQSTNHKSLKRKIRRK